MKKNLLKLTAVSSLLLSAATLASESAEIKVTGEITTASCEVTMANNGVLDFGKISQAQISDKTITSLGNKGGEKVHVKCSAPTALTFTTTDNRLGTASHTIGGWNFGLGNVNGAGKLGYYRLELRDPTVDGEASRIFAASSEGTISVAGRVLTVEQGKRIGWSPHSGEQELAIGKDFAFSLSANAYLASKGEMNGALGEDASLDGSATMEFGFGL